MSVEKDKVQRTREESGREAKSRKLERRTEGWKGGDEGRRRGGEEEGERSGG